MMQIHSNCSASISELKKNPTALLNEADGSPIVILNHNKPTAYLVPAETYERMIDKLDDAELTQIVKERAKEKAEAVSWSHLSLSAAMQGVQEEAAVYTKDDLKETYR